MPRRFMAATVFCLPALIMLASADAADRIGPYLSLTGGYTQVGGDTEFTNVVIEGQPLPDTRFSLDDGWESLLALGSYVSSNIRLEAELGYRYNGVEKVRVDGSAYSVDVDYHGAYSLMLNTYFDLPLNRTFELYVGGGIGAVFVPASIHYQSATSRASAEGTLVSGGGQLMAGMTVNLAEALHLSVGYRLFATSDSVEGHEFSGDWSLPIMHAAEISLRFDL